MKKFILIILLLIVFSVSLGYVLSQLTTNTTERAGIVDIFTETKAVCEELKDPDCYYRCHDEVFLIVGGKKTSISKSDEHVCHEEGWIDPRVRP